MGSAFGPGGMKMGPGSPRIGGGLGLGGQGGPGNVGSAGGLGLGAGIMGPPGLPRTTSGDAMNMNIMGNANPNAGININMINGQRQSPRPQSSMGMTADIASQLGLPPPTGPQQQQRQGSMPPQFSNPQQQQQMRQGSLPPGPGPGQQQQRQKMGQDGMNMNIGGGGMGMSMGGAMGMGMKSNNEMRAGTSTTPMNMGMVGMNSMGNMGGIGNMGGMNSGMMNSSMNNMGGMNPMNMTMNIPPAPHSTSSNSSAPHTPASPLLGGGGLGPQGIVPSLSASSIGSNTGGGQMTMPSTMPSIQQTPSMGPASMSSISASNSGPTAIGDAPGTSSTPAIASTSTASTIGAPSNTSSLPPLPPHVKPSTTQITTFPLATAHLHIPVLTSPEISHIQGWMKKDQEYEVILGKSKERMVEEVREALGTGSSSGVGGTVPGWWEMPGTGNFNRWRRRGETFEVRYPRTKREREREREREGRGKKSVRREGLKLFVSSFCFLM
jgi:SWI/SNF-related matrix-associated actin-dependent regulator of chromatin subfamily B protein 1